MVLTSICAALGFHLLSIHSEPGFNDRNPGLYCRTPEDLVVGTYYNSIHRQTVYLGQYVPVWHSGRIEVGALAGIGSGYHVVPVLPMIIPTASVRVSERWSARLSLAPKLHRDGAFALNLAMEYKF